ncbi:3'(2'),5'-bisphosphate nucleotidase CysQ [Bradyrhizobium ontarionense]|uniref:3'(2'),5'-bisphosphate nucleotidase CysQ n=2 Tax=Bradyrhizobium ontarionense TaxID=2898149 RepID=A0ABY3RM46_9BRAD|nr:3'(2'),5'-bisphosphate nucleotidase CysQ [Bradyrhizobium sp. A19]UFZ08374.1 3'(2'),5'-bisphosphate nucleotidase CysQ [Bradyrhizobium sp. A19]
MTSPTAGAVDIGSAAALMAPLTELVVEAAHAILAVNRRAMSVTDKSDGSPVTEADLAADRVIADGLARLAPEIPALSEERVGASAPPFKGSFFLIDPLDGTKEFVAGRGEFTVNLALVSAASPLLGIVCAPAIGLIWRGLVGRGAERLSFTETGLGVPEPIRTRPAPKPGEAWVAAVSRSHGDARTEAFIQARPGAMRLPLGSAVKFGRLAEGLADIYPRLGPTSEWDVAAGHAVVTAAGGTVTSETGTPLRYGERTDGFIVPSFIAWGDPAVVKAA